MYGNSPYVDLDFSGGLTESQSRLQQAIDGRDTDYLVQEIEMLKDEIEELKLELMLAREDFIQNTARHGITPKRRRNFK